MLSHNSGGLRVLVVMPHYFNAENQQGNKTKDLRSMAIVRSVSSCIQHFGGSQMFLNFSDKQAAFANYSNECRCDIYICTTGDQHLLKELDLIKGLYCHVETDAHPRLLGFVCREVLKAFRGKYDYYCYIEDDLFLMDPLFFKKLRWFNSVTGNEFLLQPNRYEASFNQDVKKCYIDGDCAPAGNSSESLTFQALGEDFTFTEATNPHSGCYFLNAEQFEHWSDQPHFNDWDVSWVGPLESAATLGIMRTFKIYKPAWKNGGFLEIGHFGDAYLQMVGTDILLPEASRLQSMTPCQLPHKIQTWPVARMPISLSSCNDACQ